jgi:N utilization substance protein A
MKGSRVQAVVQELRGEKIDIVPFDRDNARFVCNAIAPAEVSRVIIDEGNNSMELVVPDIKLSLAIGRRGQNVRLASQLTGWRLDIISEARFRQIEDQAMAALSMISDVDESLAKAFYRAGFRSLDEILEASEQELAGVDGIGSETRAVAVKAQAAEAATRYRAKRVAGAIERGEPLTERDLMLLCRGVTERAADALERGGYRTLVDIQRETDIDRLAIKTGLGNQKVREIREGVARLVDEHLDAIRSSIRTHEAQLAEAQLAEAQLAEAQLAGDHPQPEQEG